MPVIQTKLINPKPMCERLLIALFLPNFQTTKFSLPHSQPTEFNMRHQYFALNKPYGYLSQFSDEASHPGLLKLNLGLPKDVYPIGRLDRDSEGLLLLTNDNRFKSEMISPEGEHERRYWVQVEGEPQAQEMHAFERPMELTIRKNAFTTRPASAQVLNNIEVPERTPPIRHRLNVPTTWLEISLTEGKNRQVRKMTAHVGFPTLRLIRKGFGSLDLDQLEIEIGKVQELTQEEAYKALRNS